jgi:hypothetical protein
MIENQRRIVSLSFHNPSFSCRRLVSPPLLGYAIRMKRKLFLAGLSFVFLSCIGVESKMTLAANGSGTVELVYTVSSFALDWDSSGEADSLPLPADEADFRRGVAAAEGLTLNSYSRAAVGETTVITAVLGFASLDALNQFVSGSRTTFTLRQEGGRTVFEQLVTPGTKGGLDGQMREFVQAFCNAYSLKFSLTAPRPVARVSPPGTSSGTQASVSFPLPEVLGSAEPVLWRVEW